MSNFAQFDNIFRGLDSPTGRLRLQEGGLGFKATSEDASGSNSGTFTMEAEKMKTFQWIK